MFKNSFRMSVITLITSLFSWTTQTYDDYEYLVSTGIDVTGISLRRLGMRRN